MAAESSSESSFQSIYDQYASITQKYKALYGERTVVLMEVGKFYELYDCDKRLGADLPLICGILGIQLSRKNKNIKEVSRKNPWMAGVPDKSGPKFVQVLIDAGFTVVMCIQVTPPPNPKREVTEVISLATSAASTFLFSNSGGVATALESSAASASADGNKLMAMQVEKGRGWMGVGWAVVDLSTGRTSAGELIATEASGDTTSTMDALRRAVVESRPCEAVLVRHGANGSECPSTESICAQIGIVRRTVHERNYDMSPTHQNAVLSKAFPKTGFLSPAEFVDLERRPHALAAFVAAIEFAYEHNPAVVARILPPVIRSCGCESDEDDEEEGEGGRTSTSMDLGPDTMRQLDVISSVPEAATLMGMLNRCKTPAGRRGFRERLLNPTCCIGTLNARYDAIDNFIRDPAKAASVGRHLAAIGDLERVFRRVASLRKIPANAGSMFDTLSTLATWFHNARDALEAYGDGHGHGDGDGSGSADSRILAASKHAAAAGAAIEARIDPSGTSLFKRGVHPTVDQAQDELDMAKAVFHSAAAALNSAIGSDHVKVDGLGDTNDNVIGTNGVHLTITAKRWQAAVSTGAIQGAVVEPWFHGDQASLGPPVQRTVTASAASAAAGNRRIEHPSLGPAASERIGRAMYALSSEVEARTLELLEELDESHSDGVCMVVKEIEALDVALTCARNAVEMGHVRPSLFPPSGTGTPAGTPAGTRTRTRTRGGSFVNVKQIRHPIIESILLDRIERYVANDVALGIGGHLGGGSSSPVGMLLYGVNAVGKSSTMKAVGLAVLMAQAGFFVAADSIELVPYRALYTRVGLRDDLTRGHSTFMVEMLELRAILKRSRNRTMVIGDELCAGTESTSALAIVGAAVSMLANAGATFMFATHLHELVELPIIEKMGKDGLISIMHLSVRHDPATGKLTMDRRLSPGTGPPTYGLEVCRSLDMDPAFMSSAEAIRRHVMSSPSLVSARRSRYNARVVVDACGVCGRLATETHHIKPQAIAESHVKNRKHNLVPLCEKCHLAAHSGEIEIEGYTRTSEGVELAVTKNS